MFHLEASCRYVCVCVCVLLCLVIMLIYIILYRWSVAKSLFDFKDSIHSCQKPDSYINVSRLYWLYVLVHPVLV